MGRPRCDLTGMKFGGLEALEFSHMDKHRTSKWLCVCGCGTTVLVSAANLKNGLTKSCGCFKKRVNAEQMKARAQKLIFRPCFSKKRIDLDDALDDLEQLA